MESGEFPSLASQAIVLVACISGQFPEPGVSSLPAGLAEAAQTCRGRMGSSKGQTSSGPWLHDTPGRKFLGSSGHSLNTRARAWEGGTSAT